jgi:phosphatidylinositol alpha-mannosyltransferase
VSAPAPDAPAQPLRVALLNFAFWPEVQRGSERILHDLAVDLVALAHEPRLITSHRGAPRRSVEDGFAITRHWRPPRRLLKLRKIEPNLTHLPFSYASLRLGSDDLAQAFFPTDAVAAARWSRESGRPAVFAHMGIPQREVISTPRLRLRVLQEATRASAAVTVLSRAAQEGMWRWLGVEARLIHPGVRLDMFAPGGERDEQPTIACGAAVDDDRKRIGLLVKAFALVRRQRPGARLVLLRPEDPAVAERFAAETDGIEFFDPDTSGVADVFRRAWVTALTSYKEAFGLVVVESLACGTPVVGTRDGGIPEILDRPEVGRLFDGDDPRTVADCLLEALELAGDPATRAACRARAEDFSTMTTARAYESLYRELLDA